MKKIDFTEAVRQIALPVSGGKDLFPDPFFMINDQYGILFCFRHYGGA